MTMDDVKNDARKTAREARDVASDRLEDLHDDLIVYAGQKPLIALHRT